MDLKNDNIHFVVDKRDFHTIHIVTGDWSKTLCDIITYEDLLFFRTIIWQYYYGITASLDTAIAKTNQFLKEMFEGKIITLDEVEYEVSETEDFTDKLILCPHCLERYQQEPDLIHVIFDENARW